MNIVTTVQALAILAFFTTARFWFLLTDQLATEAGFNKVFLWGLFSGGSIGALVTLLFQFLSKG
jgi:membrane-bound acyltransferase YfiQ involved in biofilm formation